jgi:hypothetical protein
VARRVQRDDLVARRQVRRYLTPRPTRLSEAVDEYHRVALAPGLGVKSFGLGSSHAMILT